MRRALRTIGNLLIILVILAYVPIVVPNLMGLSAYNVISGSMEPTISVGSIVYVEAVTFDELGEGDIIAFNSGASVVTHRIVSIDRDNQLITTKGDANSSNDFNPVAYTNVLGTVHYYVPFMGNIAGFISDSVGKIVSVFILLVGFALSCVGDNKKKKSKNFEDGDGEVKTNIKRQFNPKIILVMGLVIICGAVIGFMCIYMEYQKSNELYSSLNQEYVESQSGQESVEWYEMMDVDFDALHQINEDVIAWIYVEGTDISYPILYSGDDEAYLRTSIDGQHATAGSIFLEGYNLPDFTDSHNIVYGHNMRNLSMFGKLKYYKSDEDYLEEHKYFQIIMPDVKYRYEIFSYFDTEAASWVYAVPYSDSEEFGEYINRLLSNSYENIETESEITSKDKITTLSTCSSSGMRFTVHGYVCDTHL